MFLFLSLWIVATITFFLMHAIPGDPFSQEQALPEEIQKALCAHYGLDKPLFIQYLQYLKGLLFFDLGPSLKYPGRQVSAIIQEGFPVSLCLGIEALLLSIPLGIFLGGVSALKAGKWQDLVSLLVTTLCLSIPSFLLATFLQYLFAMKIPLFPVARWGSFSQSILPALSLAALPAAFIARLSRSSMLEILSQDYIQTARAKGLSEPVILFRHVLRNALLPVIAYLGPLTASILTGSFAVEKIFGIPGLGKWFVFSIRDRDYTTIMGTALFYSVLLMTSVVVFDLLLGFLDPKTKKESPIGLFYDR